MSITQDRETSVVEATPHQLFIGGEWRDASGGGTLAVEDLGRHLRHALTLDLPSLIVVPIDYSIDVSISHELGTETVAA